MAGNLFNRLFTYRPRPNRHPLEDFITEALAYLLNSSTKLAIAYIDIFYPTGGQRRITSVRTQERTTRGKFVDLIIRWQENGESYSLAVENKVWTKPWQELAESGETLNSQIEEYCLYQNLRNVSTGSDKHFTALVSPTPIKEFGKGQVRYCNYLGNIKWQDICHTLEEQIEHMSNDHQKTFTSELVLFIKENNMNGFNGFKIDQLATIKSNEKYNQNILRLTEAIRDKFRESLQQEPCQLQYDEVWGEIKYDHSYGIVLQNRGHYKMESPLIVFNGIATMPRGDSEWLPPLINNDDAIPDVECAVCMTFDKLSERQAFIEENDLEGNIDLRLAPYEQHFAQNDSLNEFWLTYTYRKSLLSFLNEKDQLESILTFLSAGVDELFGDNSVKMKGLIKAYNSLPASEGKCPVGP